MNRQAYVSRLEIGDGGREPWVEWFEIYPTDESGSWNKSLKFGRMATRLGNLYPFSGAVTKIRIPGLNQSNMG